MAGLKILYNLILKDAARGSGQASGILSIGKDIRKLADKKLQRYITAAQKQGVDLDKLSEQEIKYMLELNKPKAPRVFSNEEAYKFLKQFLSQGKGKSEVVKFPKDKIKDVTKAKSRPPETEIIKGIETTKGLGDLFPKQLEKTVTVRTVIEDIKKLKPIESMKETNRVLKGEGKYKNLSKADREKIANDESVNDHIFERNIIDETEDFADGGVAGLLGERPGYQTGGFLQLTPQNIAQAKSLTYPQAYQLDKTLGFKSNFPGGVGLGKYGLEGVKSVFGFGDQKIGGATPLTRKVALDVMDYAPKVLSFAVSPLE